MPDLTQPDWDNVRITYHPYPESVIERLTNMNGEPYEVIHNGCLRIEADVPEGVYTQMHSVSDDPGPENIEEQRPMIVSMIRHAYHNDLAERRIRSMIVEDKEILDKLAEND